MLSSGRRAVVRRACQVAMLGSLAALASLFWIAGVALLTESHTLMRGGVYGFIAALAVIGCSVVVLAAVVVTDSNRRLSQHSTQGRP